MQHKICKLLNYLNNNVSGPPLITSKNLQRWNVANRKNDTPDALPMCQDKFGHLGWNHLAHTVLKG